MVRHLGGPVRARERPGRPQPAHRGVGVERGRRCRGRRGPGVRGPRRAPSAASSWSTPGRYAATIGVEPTGPDEPMATASQRPLDAFTAVLRGYEIKKGDVDHAPRMLRGLCHGFATLQAANGFQRSVDVDDGFEWLIAFADRGLGAG
ncbi:TetR-like C-terminal domain-containing protein [Actinoallomurus sp. CA-142502]|uniref:TetR-like C-terminal domain-containing protein n=1 Tax=Actinoallomurus sp. CA-142502 TaxID=3239885 RepID=UPI003D8CAD9E